MRLEPSEPEPPLHQAARNNNVTHIRELLDAGAEIDAVYFPETALGAAALAGHLDAVSLLLERGADPDICDEFCPLMAAIWGGHVAVVRKLLESGADPNDRETHFQQTALMWAINDGLTEIVALLLLHGANPNMADWFGDTAFDMAEKRNDEVISGILYRSGHIDAVPIEFVEVGASLRARQRYP